MSQLSDQLRDHPPRDWKPRPQILAGDPLPLPIHGLAPRTLLSTEWWDAVRFNAYRSTNYHCIACSTRRGAADWCKVLHGHEVYEVDYLLGRVTYVETVPLCPRCHMFCHPGYLNIKYQQGLIPYTEYATIIAHGQTVLRMAMITVDRISRSDQPPDWSDWRMVIGDAEYKPLFKSIEDYNRHYNGKP